MTETRQKTQKILQEKDNETYVKLVGSATPEIIGNRLPTNKQVLLCYFFYTRFYQPKLTSPEAKKRTIQKVAQFWHYAKIPMVRESHAIKKLGSLVDYHDSIRKIASQAEKSEKCKERLENFLVHLEQLFDIAHEKEISTCKDKEAITLLNLHRKGAPKALLGETIDTGKSNDDGSEARGENTESQKPLGKLKTIIGTIFSSISTGKQKFVLYFYL